MNARLLFLASALCALGAACTSHVDSADSPVWTNDSYVLTLAVHSGNLPPKPGSNCYGSLQYVNASPAHLTARLCASAGAFDRTLTADEATRVRALAGAIRRTAGSPACIPDVGSDTLTVVGQDGSVHTYGTCASAEVEAAVDAEGTNALLNELVAIADDHPVAAPWRDSSRLLVLTTQDGLVYHPNGNECAGETYRYDRAGKSLHAERCNGGAKVLPQDIALSSAQIAQLEAAATGLVPAPSSGCVPDQGTAEVTITDDAGVPQSFGCTDRETFTEQSLSALEAAIRAIAS